MTSQGKGSVQVGFVGLGKMGWPMAQNLANARYPLVVHDLEEERQSGFAADHDCVAADGPEAFAGAGLVITMLPDDRSVRAAVLEWQGGIASSLASGSVVVDMSSSNPEGTKRLGAELRKRGLGGLYDR